MRKFAGIALLSLTRIAEGCDQITPGAKGSSCPSLESCTGNAPFGLGPCKTTVAGNFYCDDIARYGNQCNACSCKKGCEADGGSGTPRNWRPGATNPFGMGTSANGGPIDLSTAQQTALVAQHNFVRAYHGACPIQWSDEITQVVKDTALSKWKSSCALEHTTNAARNGKAGFPFLGENLASASGPYYANNFPVDLKTMAWYLEEYDYDYSNPGTSTGGDIGHFTQVVWKGTTHVGCAMFQCDYQYGKKVLLACQYGPGGNMGGQYGANVGERGTTATGCTACGGSTTTDAPSDAPTAATSSPVRATDAPTDAPTAATSSPVPAVTSAPVSPATSSPVSGSSATSSPVSGSSTTSSPVSGSSATASPVSGSSTTSSPVSGSSATSSPVSGSSTTSSPVSGSTSSPVSGPSATSSPVSGSSATSSPASGSSTTTSPVSGSSATSSPVSGSSTTSSPVSGSVATSSPVSGSSATSSPVSGSSTTSSPVSGSSATSSPVSGSSATNSPVTGSSTTSSPVSGSSATTSPVSGSSATSAPVSGSSATTSPVSGSSATSSPGSSATSSPVSGSSGTGTAAPLPAGATAAPTSPPLGQGETHAPTTLRQAAGWTPREDSEDDSSSWVPYVLIGAGLVCCLCGLVAYFVVRRRRGPRIGKFYSSSSSSEECGSDGHDNPAANQSAPAGLVGTGDYDELPVTSI